MALADEMIATLMKNLEITEEEAKEVIECDKRIDKGEKLFELPEEKKEVEKKMRQADRKQNAVNAYGQKVTRDKKENASKAYILDKLREAVQGFADTEIVKPEREFVFIYENVKYKVALSCPRS